MLRAGDSVGPYRLINKLGRGAFGIVWLAERTTSIATTKVALKVPLDDDVDLEVVRQEAALWVQACGHPNILPIIEANIFDNRVVIVSECATGGSLTDWLKRHGGRAPSVESAVDMIYGILSGLEHLHSRYIIHRDLKPDNILLQGDTPRLADFGIARILKASNHSSITAGTPAYMSPEAFYGKRNVQTDLWSVGVIFYLVLSGHLPFPQLDFGPLMVAILAHTPNPLPSSVPVQVQQVIMRALDKDPSKRYKSAFQMRAALKAAVAKVPRHMLNTANPPGRATARLKTLPLAANGSYESAGATVRQTQELVPLSRQTSSLLPQLIRKSATDEKVKAIAGSNSSGSAKTSTEKRKIPPRSSNPSRTRNESSRKFDKGFLAGLAGFLLSASIASVVAFYAINEFFPRFRTNTASLNSESQYPASAGSSKGFENRSPTDTKTLVKHALDEVSATISRVEKEMPYDDPMKSMRLVRFTAFKDTLKQFFTGKVTHEEARSYAESALSQLKSVKYDLDQNNTRKPSRAVKKADCKKGVATSGPNLGCRR